MIPISPPRTRPLRGLAAGITACLLAVACSRRSSSNPAGEAVKVKEPPLAPRGDLIVPLSSSTTPSNGPPAAGGAEAAAQVAPVPDSLPARSKSNTNEVLKLGFDTLASFAYCVRVDYPESLGGRAVLVTDDSIPQRILELDGRRVAVAGYVMPLRMQARGVTEFLLVRDQLACCFGQSPRMNHWIHVTLPRNEVRLTLYQPLTVEGILRVGELKKDGSILSIYRIGEQREAGTTESPPQGSTRASAGTP